MKQVIAIIILVLSQASVKAKTYMSQQDFLSHVFSTQASNSQPQRKTLWLNKNIQQKITNILQHPYPKLRLRYWLKEEQSVWFLDEIGKERPISFAVLIHQNKIQQIKVLAFRESRGSEIKMQAFTDQFSNITLDDENRLNQNIDGITGATMSVTAMKKVARMALMLAKHVNQ